MLLSGFLGKLPPHLAARLAKAVEVDRLVGGTELPHEKLLQALRPQLHEIPRESRVLTAQRYFCRPFEELLNNHLPRVKQKGCIARVSVVPVWHWLARELIPEEHKILDRAINDAILHERDEEIHEKLCELWRISALAIQAALATEAQKDEVGCKLGARTIADDAAEMALLIGAGPELMQLQDKLPRRMHAATDHEIMVMRAAYDDFIARMPDVAPYVAVIAMARLERRWQALHLAGVFVNQSTDTVLASTDMGLVGEILFNELNQHRAHIVAMRSDDFDAEPMLVSLGAFAELSSGMVKELAIRRDGKWGQTLTKARVAVSEKMEEILERAPKEILAALPQPKMYGTGKAPRALDMVHPPDPLKMARARRHAYVLGHAGPFSVAAAFHAKFNDIYEEVASLLRQFAEDLLRELKTKREGEHAEEHFAGLIELCTLVLGSEETAFLHRRARAIPSPQHTAA